MTDEGVVTSFTRAAAAGYLREIPTGDVPSMVTITPNGAYLYVTNQVSHTVSVIETSSRTVVRNPITFGMGPFGVAITPSGGHA
jgi:YVTN family beta-propeller protein